MDNKGNKQWVWLALDEDTREVVGAYIGARDAAAAGKLWESLPPVYRQCAVAYTDFWAAYRAVLPSRHHRAVGKTRTAASGKASVVSRSMPHSEMCLTCWESQAHRLTALDGQWQPT